jgi:hypothetical protein
MKKLYIILIIACFAACDKNDDIGGIKITNQKLRFYLLSNYDKNRDGKISEEEALLVTEINVHGSQEPVDGLENFPNLEILDVSSGRFISIDISKNTKLKEFICISNKLRKLDVSNNTELEILMCGEYGDIDSFDLSNNTKLVKVSCSGNYPTFPTAFLDVSKCTELKFLDCGRSMFKNLDLSNNTKLQQLICNYNVEITSIDISKNTELTELDLTSAQLISSVDVSKNTKLQILSVHNLSLTTLDVSNNLELNNLTCTYNDELYTLYLKTGQTIQTLNKDEHTAIVHL